MERILPEIEKYNAVSRKICDIPSYNALKAEKKISLYFTTTGEVIIAAWAGEKYIFWLSVTKTEDVEQNTEIFHHIIYEELDCVTYLPRALAVLDRSEEELETYYHVELHYEFGVKLRKNEIPNWDGPFGHMYLRDQIEKNGAILAEDIKGCVKHQRECCALRECGGAYLAVLVQYAEELNAEEEYSHRVQLLEELLQKEDYLCLSETDAIRQTYLSCMQRCRKLKTKQV